MCINNFLAGTQGEVQRPKTKQKFYNMYKNAQHQQNLMIVSANNPSQATISVTHLTVQAN